MTLIDTNVLLDLANDDPLWADWSSSTLAAASLRGPLLINDVIYAELCVGYDQRDELDHFLLEAGIAIEPMPRPALFLAAKAFKAYKALGGTRAGVLPDFFIGAHATVSGWPLVTRDVRRFRTHFPTLALITPGL